jgi:hypothetical protein
VPAVFAAELPATLGRVVVVPAVPPRLPPLPVTVAGLPAVDPPCPLTPTLLPVAVASVLEPQAPANTTGNTADSTLRCNR